MDEEALKWKKRFERERLSRKQAEKLLEDKSAELYELNLSLEKRVEEEVSKNAQKERMLFQQSKMASMGEMISNIAHQWRQPLQAIAIVTQKLEIIKMIEGEITDEHIEEVVGTVNGQLEYLTNTIDDFRNFFRPDKEKEVFELNGSFDKAFSILNFSIKKESIKVYKDIENITMYNLENELVQVLLNLIKNAIDILVDKKLPKKIIKLSAKEKDSKLYIQVQDNAGGVPEDIIDNIFEPYFTTKHKSKGTGLGLYMSHTIIYNHMAGELFVKNEEFENEGETYKGACFNIIIPLIKESSE